MTQKQSKATIKETPSVDYRLHDDQGLSIERKELYDKLNRLDYYQAKVQKRMADLERKLKRVYELDQETQAIINAGLEVMALKSDKESTR